MGVSQKWPLMALRQRFMGPRFFPSVFLDEAGWKQIEQEGKNSWQGLYEQSGRRLNIHAKSGVGDVVTTVGDKRVCAECKGGPLVRKPGSPEYRILRGGLGQVVTVEQIDPDGLLVVAACPRWGHTNRVGFRASTQPTTALSSCP